MELIQIFVQICCTQWKIWDECEHFCHHILFILQSCKSNSFLTFAVLLTVKTKT